MNLGLFLFCLLVLKLLGFVFPEYSSHPGRLERNLRSSHDSRSWDFWNSTKYHNACIKATKPQELAELCHQHQCFENPSQNDFTALICVASPLLDWGLHWVISATLLTECNRVNKNKVNSRTKPVPCNPCPAWPLYSHILLVSHQHCESISSDP